MKLNSRKAIKALYDRDALLKNPGTPFGLKVALEGRKGRGGGYISRLNRLRKKTPGQLKGLPGCGPRVNDWLLPY